MQVSTRQHLCDILTSGGGALLCTSAYFGVTHGVMWLAGLSAFGLSMGIFMILVRCFERDPVTRKSRRLYHLGQSWLFMAGPFLLTPMFVVAAYDWRMYGPMNRVPLWPFALIAVIVMLVFGAAFRRVDHRRYFEQYAKSMLDSPSKVWLDYWQMPACVALIVAVVSPTWWMPGDLRWFTLELFACCAVLAVMDATAQLDPYEQHVLWNRRECRPLKDGEAANL